MSGENVAPRVGAWIETKILTHIACCWASHPEWVRGLKLLSVCSAMRQGLSHPEWVRGLKLVNHHANAQGHGVAPRVGAWIETVISRCLILEYHSRTPSGCVD